MDLGEKGLVPLEVRWLHDPDADEGFVAAALSSVVWHFHRENGSFAADPVIEEESVPLEGWPTEGRGPAYGAAIKACFAALEGTGDVEVERQAFIAAAKEVGIFVREGR